MQRNDAGDVAVLTIVKGRTAHLHAQLAGLARGTALPSLCVIVDMDAVPVSLPSMPFPVDRLHMPSGGLPLAAARNAAARLAKAETLVFLDVDCIPASSLVGALAADVATADALICCEVRYLADEDRDLGETDMRARGCRHPVRSFPAAGLRAEPNAGLFWSLAFAMRRGSFERLGGFDEGFTGYGAEDTDFAFRARDAGLPLLFTGSTLAFHQHHAIHDPPLQHFDDILRNADRFHARHGIWPMEGWLDAFARMGLIATPPARGTLTVLRRPSPAEIATSTCPPHRVF